MQTTSNRTRGDAASSPEPKVCTKFLTFVIGQACYGLDIKDVTEIIGIHKITAMPNMPPYIKGVINLRGNIIPVMDVRARFGLEDREYDDRTCIIIIDVDETLLGLAVDTVNEVLDIEHTQIQPPLSIGNETANTFINGLGKVGTDVKVLLDAHRLINATSL